MAKSKKNSSDTTSKAQISEQTLPKEFNINSQTVLGILVVLVGLAYMKIWQNGVVWDDNQYIFRNDIVKKLRLERYFHNLSNG